MTDTNVSSVSRERYNREKAARAEAEMLLERLGTQLFKANEALAQHSAQLERIVEERTAELRDALALAKHESTVRTRFIATMSHEIRTPLGGLLGMIDLLTMDETDPAKLELLKNASISGVSLRRIVNDVLDFAKMDAGVLVFVEEAVDLRALIESVASLARTTVEKSGRTILTKIEHSVPKLFSGDATRIRQVVSNFVSNATRYSETGPIIIRAKGLGAGDNMVVRVEVEDFGVGIASEKISELFKDFSQIANSLTASSQGTGLGLAISKRIVEGCGGTVGVESNLGLGSTFWFELPVKILQESALQSEKSPSVVKEEQDVLSGLRVLLAEDNTINQKLLMTYLKRMGAIPELAANGAIAVRKFQPGAFDFMVMDVAMPEVDGLEAVRMIKASWPAKDIPPIVFLTAHEMPAIRDEAYQLGADELLSKPIPFDEFREAIQRVMSNRLAAKLQHEDAGSTVLEPAAAAPIPQAVVSMISEDVRQSMLALMSESELEQMILDYRAEADRFIVRFRSEYVNKNFKACKDLAHSLKGSSLILGIEEIAKQARYLETQALEIDVSQVELALGEIHKALQ